jgi:hypothetical protein
MTRITAALGSGVLAITLLSDAPLASAIMVRAGEDLQAALNAARPGDVILLEPRATFVGNFVLPPRAAGDSRPITLRTNGTAVVGEGERMSPERAESLAKLKSPNNLPALATSPRTRFWRVELIEFAANRDGAGDIITLGDGSAAQRTLSDVPSDLLLDRLYVHGDPMLGQKRGVALNSARTTISNSYFSDFKMVGQDAQAIAGWNGPGDYLIVNNYLEGAGQNILFGGADPAILNLTPEHIVIRDNTLSKPLAWKGSPWQVKNLFELKNARDVIVERNVMERNWQAAQSGYSILFTVRNQDGACPWCQVENVRFQQNIVRDVAAVFSILGADTNHPSRQTNRIVIRDNLFEGIDSEQWGGDGYFLVMTHGPRDVTIDHNTLIQRASSGIAKLEGQIEGFVFTNNVTSHGAFGIIASDHGIGNDSIRAALPGARISGNVIAGGNGSVYPPGNRFPSVDEFRRQFVNFSGGDFRLVSDSDWIGAGSDGRDLGATLIPAPGRPVPPPRRPWGATDRALPGR